MYRFLIVGVWLIAGCGGKGQETLDAQTLLLHLQLPGVFAPGGRRARELESRHCFLEVSLKSAAGWHKRIAVAWPKDRKLELPGVDFPRSSQDQLTIRLSLWFPALKHPTLTGRKVLTYEEFSRGKGSYQILTLRADSNRVR